MSDFEEALLMLIESLIKANERQAEALEKLEKRFEFEN